MTASFSLPFILPWIIPTPTSPMRSFKSLAHACALNKSFSPSPCSTVGHTTKICRPAKACLCKYKSKSSLRCGVIRCVLTGLRPGGSSSKTELSISPNSNCCIVRGIGVAVIIKTCTRAALSASSCLCNTPKRCCSSVITSPSLAN